MNIKSQIIFRFLILVFSITAFCYLSVSAQNSADSEIVKLPPPLQESFVESSGLVTPWLASGCFISFADKVPNCRFFLYTPGACDKEGYYGGVSLKKLQNCYNVSIKEHEGKEITDLYNADGSLWYRFGNKYGNPEYFGNDDQKDFLPYTITFDSKFAGAAVLRLVRESSNWYEVEVNEKTRATKFIWKSDPKWTKMTWEYWLGKKYFLLHPLPLRDKPDGEIIEESANLEFDRYAYLNKTDGDWVFVKGVKLGKAQYPKEYQGWIRWRQGRSILINP